MGLRLGERAPKQKIKARTLVLEVFFRVDFSLEMGVVMNFGPVSIRKAIGACFVLVATSTSVGATVVAAPTTFGATAGTATVVPDVVVRATSAVTIGATVSGAYSADQAPSTPTVGAFSATTGSSVTCTKGQNTYTVNESATATRTVVTYRDKGLRIGGSGGTSYSQESVTVQETVDMSNRTDGTNSASISITAEAFQTARTTTQSATYSRYVDSGGREQCRVEGSFSDTSFVDAAPSFSAAQTFTKSDSFIVDLVAPTVSADFAGGGSGVPTAPSGGNIVANIQISDATPKDDFVLTLGAYFGDSTTASFEESTPVDPANRELIGNNGSASFASIGLDVPCSTPLGSYTLRATIDFLSDRAGDDFESIVVDVGAFDVVSSVNLVGTTSVFGFVDTDGDGISDYLNLDATGFTAVKAKRAVNTYPGAFHVTSLMKTTGQCNTDTTMTFSSSAGADTTDDVVLTAPLGFAFVKTGQTYAKVYAGLDTGLFDFEKPALVGVSSSGEVTPLLGSLFETANATADPTVIRVKLGKIGYWVDSDADGVYGSIGDTWKSGGDLPADWKVFVRVRARYIGTSVPAPSTPFSWTGVVHVDGYNGAPGPAEKTNTAIIYHAPVPIP